MTDLKITLNEGLEKISGGNVQYNPLTGKYEVSVNAVFENNIAGYFDSIFDAYEFDRNLQIRIQAILDFIRGYDEYDE